MTLTEKDLEIGIYHCADKRQKDKNALLPDR